MIIINEDIINNLTREETILLLESAKDGQVFYHDMINNKRDVRLEIGEVVSDDKVKYPFTYINGETVYEFGGSWVINESKVIKVMGYDYGKECWYWVNSIPVYNNAPQKFYDIYVTLLRERNIDSI